ncbi:MAG: hypothetical protein PHW33_04640 [Candidatus Portnoybacteria bacterium]|nr:hypothetical protein [Candidatus Portnoybacteria bacterium]
MLQGTGALARLLFVDLIGSVAWFPIWWYTTGIKRMIQWCLDGLNYRVRQYAFAVWIKYFFVPMYGQYDWQGRLISVFMRTVVLIGRAIALVAEALAYVFLVFVWALLPPLAFILALQNIMSGAFMSQVPRP